MSHIPLELTITIGRKQLSWPTCMERTEFDSILKALVERLGEPSYRILPEAGDVGPNRREIVVEPVPETKPEPITVPEPGPA